VKFVNVGSSETSVNFYKLHGVTTSSLRPLDSQTSHCQSTLKNLKNCVSIANCFKQSRPVCLQPKSGLVVQEISCFVQNVSQHLHALLPRFKIHTKLLYTIIIAGKTYYHINLYILTPQRGISLCSVWFVEYIHIISLSSINPMSFVMEVPVAWHMNWIWKCNLYEFQV
jgi:hypothetical protein